MTRSKRRMVKVCDICGDIGFAEYIFNCYQCKNASEHIYCMQGQGLTIPDIWYCEVCKLNTQVAHEGNGQDSHIERMSVKGASSDLERSKTPLGKILPMNYWGSPEQTTDGEKQVSGAKKLIYCPDNSSKMVDTGNERRVPVAGFPDKPVTQQLSHNTYFRTVENAKVKFIPSEEVAFLTSRERTARRWSNLGGSHREIGVTKGKPPPSLRRMSTDESTSHDPNTLNVLAQTNKGSIHVEEHFSHVKHAMTKEHARNNHNARSQKRKVSEIEASAGLCKKKLTKECVGAEGYLSSTKLTTPTVSDVPVLPIDEKRNRATVKALGADVLPAPHVSGKHVEAFVDAEVKDSPMNNARPADSKHIDHKLPDTDKNEKMRTGNVVRPDASSSGFQEMNLPLTFITSPCEKTPNRVTPGACWK
uniref:Uncharacterized protein LOC109506653 n=1 Tax=Elaeis guineensis var. tenera TaxID=51953 RepID=A0A8N4IJD4_ELAGV|nr:uncharacterized protein LOC109506653 [Elaeis guineensis]